MKKILIVEDNKDILESTAELLEFKGYGIVTAKNGREGLELAKDTLPDLIISDIMMPQMDGYEMLNKLRSDPQTALIPFIFLTSKAQKKDILQGAVSGADRYVTKPFVFATLMKAIQEIMDILPDRSKN